MERKIALINPPSPFLINERVFPNLGIVQLATSFEEKGVKAPIYDFAGKTNYLEELKYLIGKENIIGFSCTTPQFPFVFEMNELIKRSSPETKTILGGPHASAMFPLRHKEKEPNVDSLNNFNIIFSGEGENFDPLLFFKENSKWVEGGFLKDINQSPIPDRSLIDINSYNYSLQGKKTTTIMSQRGCPFNCVFCSGRDIPMYRHMRLKNSQEVLKELDYLKDNFGFDSFMWYDDELNSNPSRLEELCDVLSKRKYQHRGFVRSDIIAKRPSLVESLYSAGFVELCSGVESGSDRVLKLINKKCNVDMNTFTAKAIKERGIKYKAFLIFGNPGEGFADAEKTLRWVEKVHPDGWDSTILVPYPGARIYNSALPSNKFRGYDFSWEDQLFFKRQDFSKDSSFFKGRKGEYVCSVRTPKLSSEEILSFRDKLEEMKK